jgi:predicted PP-loop superfamily ATPase
MVSTPGAELDRGSIQQERLDVADRLIDIGESCPEAVEWCLVSKRRMLANVVVAVDISQGFVQQGRVAGDGHCSWYVELLVIGAVRSLKVSVFLTMSFMVLGQPAAKARDQLAQLGYLKPGFTAELLSVIYSKENPGFDPVSPLQEITHRYQHSPFVQVFSRE